MTLNAAAQGNVYFTGYIFSDADKYTEIANLAKAWQDEGTGQAKYTAQQELTKKLDEMLNNGDAELVIPKDSRTVGGSASADGTTASYTFVPDGNGFTLTPDHAKQYLLPAVRVMPTDGRTVRRTRSYILQQDAAKAQLPAMFHAGRPWTNRNARLAMPFTRRRSTCTATPSLRAIAVRTGWSCAALRWSGPR